MNDDDRLTLEERLARLERQVAAIAAAMADSAHRRPAAATERLSHVKPSRRYESFFASRSIEWWLARGGAVLTCLALVLLYQYAVERNWITPVVRVGSGILVGVALFTAHHEFLAVITRSLTISSGCVKFSSAQGSLPGTSRHTRRPSTTG